MVDKGMNETQRGELRDRLHAAGGRLIRSDSADNGDWLWYSVQGRIVVVRTYINGGTEVFVPVTQGNTWVETFEALESYLAVDA